LWAFWSIGGADGLCPVITSLTRLSRCFSRFCMLTGGFLRAAGDGKVHREARPFFTHCEQFGFCRSHFNLAWRQFVQLSCVRFLLCGGCLGGEGDGVASSYSVNSPVGAGGDRAVSIVGVLKSEELTSREVVVS
jgi:hypothetical protein